MALTNVGLGPQREIRARMAAGVVIGMVLAMVWEPTLQLLYFAQVAAANFALVNLASATRMWPLTAALQLAVPAVLVCELVWSPGTGAVSAEVHSQLQAGLFAAGIPITLPTLGGTHIRLSMVDAMRLASFNLAAHTNHDPASVAAPTSDLLVYAHYLLYWPIFEWGPYLSFRKFHEQVEAGWGRSLSFRSATQSVLSLAALWLAIEVLLHTVAFHVVAWAEVDIFHGGLRPWEHFGHGSLYIVLDRIFIIKLVYAGPQVAAQIDGIVAPVDIDIGQTLRARSFTEFWRVYHQSYADFFYEAAYASLRTIDPSSSVYTALHGI